VDNSTRSWTTVRQIVDNLARCDVSQDTQSRADTPRDSDDSERPVGSGPRAAGSAGGPGDASRPLSERQIWEGYGGRWTDPEDDDA